MTFLTVVVAILGFVGYAMVVLAPVLLALAVSEGRQHRWVRRHPVSPCAALRPDARLPRRFAVYGETAPGPAGLVVAPLSGVEAVWFRTTVYTVDSAGDPPLTSTNVLWEQSAGDLFGVADSTGTAVVSARLLQAAIDDPRLSVWAQTRLPVAHAGPTPVRTSSARRPPVLAATAGGSRTPSTAGWSRRTRRGAWSACGWSSRSCPRAFRCTSSAGRRSSTAASPCSRCREPVATSP
ncbi:hypothetical protein [Micromonospora sp. DT227]|uniref:hypothetical protein n=1 Tax=Micromonospora sp. DT227 TaxID=3393433 RepID=UPI003CE7D29D